MTIMTTPELTPDLIEEILCRVPAPCLEQMRATCKGWNRLVKEDKRFQTKHFDKAAKEFQHLTFRYDSRGCSLRLNLYWMLSLFDPEYNCDFDIHTIFHCDGLLLCTSKDRSTIVVWNPCTRETKWIRTKNLFGICHDFYLGYCKDNESGIKSYKFLSRHGLGRQNPLIYDFDFDSWRIVDDVTERWCTAYNDYGVSLKGSIYWIVSPGLVYDKNATKCLLRFDFSTEKSQPVTLPYQRSWYDVPCLSVVRDEKLSVFVQLDEDVFKTEIWVTNKIDESTKAVSWSKVLVLDLGYGLQLTNEGSFLLDEEKKEVMFCEKKYIDESDETKSKDMLYIVGEDNKVRPVELGDDGSLPSILNYFPSLVRIKPAGRKRKRAD